MSKRMLIVGTLLLVMVGVVLVLALPAAPAAAQDDPEPTPIIAEAGEGDIHLRYWNGLTGSDGVTMVEMVQQFAEENPDVSVRVEMMAWDTYFDKLTTSLIAGDPPDLFLLHHQELPQFARLGVLMPTDDMFDYEGGPLPADDFAPPIFEATVYEGVRYGVVVDHHGWGMWVNNDLFEAAGLDPTVQPQNAEEFLEYATRLTLDANGLNPDQEGFDPANIVQYGTTVSWMKPTYLSTIWQFGGDIVSEDGTTATINSDEGRAALQFWYDMIYTYHVAPQPAGFDNWQSFAAGNLAMIPEGTWMRNFLVLENPDVNWTAWGLPQWGDVQPAAWVSSHVVYFPSTLSGDELEAARELVVYLSEQGLYWATSGQVPARISQQEALDPEVFPSNIVIGSAFQEYGIPELPSPYSIELVDAFQPEIDAALNGLKSIDAALEDANRRIQSVLDRGR
jgi:ABC-type glycerol-3-phosphate transport system substrate-binding protein